MVRRLILSVLALLIGGFLVYKFFFSPKPVFQETTVSKKDLEITLNTSGKLRASREQTVSFPILGNLEMVASSGASFRKGEILARLKTNDLWATLQQAYAALNKANSTFYYYLEVKSETDKTYGWKEDGISKAKVNQADNNVAGARDSVEAAEFAVDGAKAAYQKAFAVASFDGVVGQTLLRLGETAAPGQTVLTFLDPATFYFEAEIDEDDIKSTQIGQKVKIILDSFSGQTIAGEVTSLDLSAHATSSGGTAYFAKISLIDVPATVSLRPGLNGEARVLSEIKKDVLVVPAAFVTTHEGKYEVLVKTENGSQKREIKIGEFVDGQYEIVSGLVMGETVLAPEIK